MIVLDLYRWADVTHKQHMAFRTEAFMVSIVPYKKGLAGYDVY